MDLSATFVTKQLFNNLKDLFLIGGKIRESDDYFSIEPVNWNPDKKDRNWLRQLHMWRFLDPVFSEEIDALGEKQIQVFESVIWSWSIWEGENADFSKQNVWIDHVVGVRASKIAILLNNANLFSTQFADLLKKISLQHISMLDKKRFIKINNHGVFDVHGLMLLLQAMPSEWLTLSRKKCIKNKLDNLATLVWKSQFTEQGLHKENSPHYHYVAKFLLKKYLHSGLYSQNEYIASLYHKLKLGEKYQHYFDGRLLPFGDSDMIVKKKATDIALEAVHKNIRKYNSNNCIVSADSLDGRVVVNYIKNGVASTIAINCAYYEKTHKHFDCQSLVWSESIDVLIDGGKYSYEKCHDREYIISPKAHNVFYQEGDYGYKKPEVLYGNGIVFFRSNDKYFVCMSKVPGFIRDSFSYRAIIFSINTGLVISDKMVSSQISPMVSNWILGPYINIDVDSSSNVIVLSENDLLFRFQERYLSGDKEYLAAEKVSVGGFGEYREEKVGLFSSSFLEMKKTKYMYIKYSSVGSLTKVSMFLRGENDVNVRYDKLNDITLVELDGGVFEIDFGQNKISSCLVV